MIGLERLLAGTGSHAVVAHLADVHTDARRALVRAPEHRDYLCATLDLWADLAAGDLRPMLDRAGPDLAVAQFARTLAPQSRTGVSVERARDLVRTLRAHGWLTPVTYGPRPLYRAQVGVPFGVTTGAGR